MHEIYTSFLKLLDKEDRQACVELAISRLAAGEIGIVTLYQDVLAPALREKVNHDTGKTLSVWREHIRTSIIRTIIECCYPFIVREKSAQASRGRVIIFCPHEELHEIGARMAVDFFVLCGFEAIFIGANTPRQDIIDAIRDAIPDYVAISVSNDYNLVAARRTIQQIIEVKEREQLKFRIIAGGTAFDGRPGLTNEIGAEFLLQTFEDIKRFAEAH
jgi:MerR family transcriptional regulator, light-induced transcriptional regulator